MGYGRREPAAPGALGTDILTAVALCHASIPPSRHRLCSVAAPSSAATSSCSRPRFGLGWEQQPLLEALTWKQSLL